MKDDTDKDAAKIQAILTAGFETFAQYGYRKTSMEDLARAAGMSRPALYQYFKNKEDIARSLVRGYFSSATQNVQASLQGGGPPEQVLERMFRAKLHGIEAMLAAPHAEELLEMGHAVSAEDVAEGMAQIEEALAKWLEQARAVRLIQFEGSAIEVSKVIWTAFAGIKQPPLETLEARVVVLAQLLGRGLRP